MRSFLSINRVSSPVCLARMASRGAKHSSVRSNQVRSYMIVKLCRVSNWESASVWRNWTPSDRSLYVPLRHSERKQLLKVMA